MKSEATCGNEVTFHFLNMSISLVMQVLFKVPTVCTKCTLMVCLKQGSLQCEKEGSKVAAAGVSRVGKKISKGIPVKSS